MSELMKVPAVLMRGGTSKGLVINKNDLPNDYNLRDRLILRIFGSPDIRQIDGIGGGTPVTSKLALIEESKTDDIDIIYTFGQVSILEESIDYKPTCGNISAGVGLYAVEEGIAKIEDRMTTVRIYNTNTEKIIEVEVPTANGEVTYEGDYKIAGVPGGYPRINVNFLDSGGGITGQLLPTGNVQDKIVLEQGDAYNISIVDSGNTLVFVGAGEIGIEGTETGTAFNQKDTLDKIEKIRAAAGRKIGLIGKDAIVSPVSHALPKIAIVSSPATYTTSNDQTIQESQMDVLGRYVAMGALHESFAVSGGIAIATASQIPGTIINEIFESRAGESVRIGHPSGVIEAEAIVESDNEELKVKRAAIGRSARRIMEGRVIVDSSVESAP